ncbi:MAG: hypothetical protein EXQ70_06315 [Solirubrobacterales bacterium]|nr:hypothetical protein [Solirubrobacterales bacterium]
MKRLVGTFTVLVVAAPLTRNFTVNSTPPDTILDSNPGAFITDTTPTFSFSSTPGGGSFECAIADGINLVEVDAGEFGSSEGDSSFECRLDAAAFAPCTSPKGFKVKIGRHSFQVRATDQAGNADASPASKSFTVKTKKRKRR